MAGLEVVPRYIYTEEAYSSVYQLEIEELKGAPKGFMRRALETILAELGDEDE